MARALFLGLPLRGHTNPTLPLVRELAARGDEITYYSSDRFAAEIERAGARYRAYRDPVVADLSRLPLYSEQMSWLFMSAAARVLAGQLDAFRAERPDYVIADSVAPWGQWTASILRVPLVTSISTFAFNRHVLAFGAARGVRPTSVGRMLSKAGHLTRSHLLWRRLRRTYGVDGPGAFRSLIGSSDLNIVYTSRFFQPRAETFDRRFHFVGPMLSRVEIDDLPWAQVGQRDVVFVSLGTLFNDNLPFFRTCVEACAGEDVQLILSTGPHVPAAALGVVPANAIVRPYVPQLAVLRRASAFITHGGMNSVSESLASGVPMVVIPQMGEQAIVGRRVEEVGAGLYLGNAEATRERLRASVHRLLTEPRFRERAAVVRRSFEETGGAPAAADAIVAFTDATCQTRRRRPSPS